MPTSTFTREPSGAFSQMQLHWQGTVLQTWTQKSSNDQLDPAAAQYHNPPTTPIARKKLDVSQNHAILIKCNSSSIKNNPYPSQVQF
jgi:hypothetical protein